MSKALNDLSAAGYAHALNDTKINKFEQSLKDPQAIHSCIISNKIGEIYLLRNRPLIYFTTNYPNILASIRLSHLDQTAHLVLVPSTSRGEENMNVDTAEVLDVGVVEEDVKDVAGA